MKKKVFKTLIVTFLMLLLESYFSPSIPSPEDKPRIRTEESPTEITPQESTHPAETSSHSPTPIITATIFSTPTSTATSLPTLEAPQFFREIESFLLKGSDCHPMCLFGIIPGQTTTEQAFEKFRWLRHPLEPITVTSDKGFYETEVASSEKGLSIWIDITEEKGVVKNIEATLELVEEKNTTPSIKWKAFAPSTIIKKIGSPETVDFYLYFPSEEGFPPHTAWYDMVMEYDHLNLAIHYHRGLTKESGFSRVCPLTDQFASVTVYLGKGFEHPPLPGVPLEEATLLSLEQFSTLMGQEEKPACFDLSKEAFYPSNN